MQLGTRWAFGAALPAALPTPAEVPVREVEAVRQLAVAATELAGWRWTLTYLEGRPHLELEDGTLLVLNPDGSAASVTEPGTPDPDDDW
ncbi:hypothetical protein D9V34_11125 [Mycetocola lacteus]|uniref:Fe-S oxidoreductase n=1 Tax=Mycetocola lacteus TaxID=76637 RepID=A0A3L7ASE9_9MICO|nr:hypothetical protein [Mycetocola lacteus]RLP82332.1 hypothetical protein D9V34_11125 [Mycetocola lacteus]